MKNTRRRSFVVYILVLMFLFGLSVFTFKLVTNADSWALNPINRHVSGMGLSRSGKILDSTDAVLAQSVNNKRIYHHDETTRKSLLHTVGDGSSYISTSVQNLYRAELSGYSFLTGINCPSFLSFRKNIKLTLNGEVCKTALEKLGDAKGAVAVYNYKTGDIVCMVSNPSYDPYSPPIMKDKNTGNYDGVYLNRVMSGTYTPGSVFKIITSACALETAGENPLENKFNCAGTFKVNNGDITCLSSHGDIALKNAFMRSCNIYFAKLAIDLGKDKMENTAKNLGFNQSFNINKIKTAQSKYDVTDANDYCLGWSGVGQYNDLLNPMHMLTLMGAVANEGSAVMPNMIENITSENAFSFLTNIYKKVETTDFMTKETANELKEMMRYTVKNNYGDDLFKGLAVCAKTGTAEVGAGKEPHAWMVGFSSNEDTPLAFVVVAENSGYGIKSAAPIAKAVMAKAAQVTRG